MNHALSLRHAALLCHSDTGLSSAGLVQPVFTKHTMSIVEEDLEHKQLQPLHFSTPFPHPLLLILLPLAQAYDGYVFSAHLSFAALLAGMGFHWAYSLTKGALPSGTGSIIRFSHSAPLLAFLHVRLLLILLQRTGWWSTRRSGNRHGKHLLVRRINKPFWIPSMKLVPDGSTMRP